MFKRNQIFIAILILFILPSQTKADKILSLTLDECLRMVVGGSREYQIAQMRFEAAEASYSSAKLSYYVPNLNLRFTTPDYSWYGDYRDIYSYGVYQRRYAVEEYYDYTSSLDLTQKLFTGADLTISGLVNSYRRMHNIFEDYKEFRTSLQFNIEQPIFNWKRYKTSLDKARADYNLAKIQYFEESNQVLADLATNYIHYLTSQKQLGIAKLGLQKAELDFLSTEKKKEDGLISDLEFAQTRTERMDKKLELIDAKESFEEFGAKLFQMLKLDKKAKLNLSQNINLEKFSLGAEKVRDIEQSSEVLRAGTEVKKKELELREAKASGGIDGRVNFYYGFLGRGPFARESLEDFDKNRWGVSVILNLPIWDGGAHSSSVKSAKLSLEETKKQSELTKSQAKSKFENLLGKLSTSWEKLAILQEELKLAEEDLNNAQKKKDLGLLSEGQMLDAQMTFLETEVKYLNAVLDYKLSKIELDKMWGIVPVLDEK